MSLAMDLLKLSAARVAAAANAPAEPRERCAAFRVRKPDGLCRRGENIWHLRLKSHGEWHHAGCYPNAFSACDAAADHYGCEVWELPGMTFDFLAEIGNQPVLPPSRYFRSLDEVLTHKRLLEVFSYDHKDGCLRYRGVDGNPRQKRGVRVGNPERNSRNQRVVVDGKSYTIPRLVWYWHFGTWPERQVHFEDGDYRNTAINNLVLRGHKNA